MQKIRIEIKNMFDKLEHNYFKIDLYNDEAQLKE